MRKRSQSQSAHPARSFDALLRFDSATQSAYDNEHGAERARHLQFMILMGVFIYNLYNFTSIYLLPDVLWLSVAMRVCLVTPCSLLLVWQMTKVSHNMREWMVFGGMLNASLVPLFLFWYSSADLSTYSYLELPLSFVFAAIVLQLRFRFTLMLMLTMMLSTIVAIATKAGLDQELRIALALQFLTALTLVVVASFVGEKRRCIEYIRTLNAREAAANADKRSELFSKLSLTDELTGLPNRRSFEQNVQDLLQDDRDLAFLMIDIDYFKVYNDTQGHIEGDKCLRHVASALQRVADRYTGFAYRLGGEEFSLMAHVETELDARRICMDVNRTIEALDLPHGGRPDRWSKVTVSAGLALSCAPRTAHYKSLMERADEALYLAKMRGRNTYCVAGNMRRDDSQNTA